MLEPTTLYFEDVQPGDHMTSVGRTITEADIVSFAGLTGDYNLIHTDAEYAKNSIAGQRLAHGMLVLSIAVGLITRTPYYTALSGALVALTDIRDHKFKKPAVIGDTIHVEMEIAEKIDGKPGGNSGKLVCHRRIVNQRGELVQEGSYSILVKKRGA